MLVASWQLNGGTTIASGLAGAARTREMRYRSQEIRVELEQAMRTGYEAVNTAKRRVAVLQKAVDSDERVVEDFEVQFKEGGRTLFDLLDAYEQLYNARLSLMRVVVAEAQASFQIRRQIGDLANALTVDKER
jgi:adhesin transport system outer membrane protein